MVLIYIFIFVFYFHTPLLKDIFMFTNLFSFWNTYFIKNYVICDRLVPNPSAMIDSVHFLLGALLPCSTPFSTCGLRGLRLSLILNLSHLQSLEPLGNFLREWWVCKSIFCVQLMSRPSWTKSWKTANGDQNKMHYTFNFYKKLYLIIKFNYSI